jgi:FKBP-type peptidyl-prolyl cis-trans isomerase (trigger factor)
MEGWVKTETKKLDGTKREINIEVTGEVVRSKFEDVFNAIAKEAKVPGFRVGHVPRDILEKHYSSHVHEQVLKELIPEVYNRAVEKEGLDVVELPQISEVKLSRDSLSFKAIVQISPEIELKNYKGIKIKYQKVSVSPDEIKRSIDALKESRKASTARNTNIIVPSSDISEGRDSLDDNFARSLGYPDLAELEKAVERQIFIQKENLQRQNIENEVIESVIKDLDFTIPQSLVNRQLQELLRQAKLDMALKGVPREKIEEQEKALSGQLEPEARTQIKVHLVLAAIAKRENIPIDDHMPRRVMEFLLREADWGGSTLKYGGGQ